MKFKFGELFCGAGGLGYAVKTAKVLGNDGEMFAIEHAWATDHDKDACNTYSRNVCDNKNSVVCKDIRKLDFTRLSAINGLAFGFPCNDFSMVGEQKGMDGAFGSLYNYGVNALNQFKPMWFLAENVSGLKNANEGTAFKIILKELENAGYQITPHLYKFEEYGVPQARHRIIIVGIRNDIGKKFKIPSTKPYQGLIHHKN